MVATTIKATEGITIVIRIMIDRSSMAIIKLMTNHQSLPQTNSSTIQVVNQALVADASSSRLQKKGKEAMDLEAEVSLAASTQAALSRSTWSKVWIKEMGKVVRQVVDYPKRSRMSDIKILTLGWLN